MNKIVYAKIYKKKISDVKKIFFISNVYLFMLNACKEFNAFVVFVCISWIL